ncbi:33495_t:CDS:10 [Racocetra persica]|uniref:33495_t:CDS:1 n=1 Tax=Racocetra persica TaxID=160502 RepID=A0ACA9LL98_9GLOM|nr:33495_t:CDS:10 [Racocetra persica]
MPENNNSLNYVQVMEERLQDHYEILERVLGKKMAGEQRNTVNELLKKITELENQIKELKSEREKGTLEILQKVFGDAIKDGKFVGRAYEVDPEIVRKENELPKEEKGKYLLPYFCEKNNIDINNPTFCSRTGKSSKLVNHLLGIKNCVLCDKIHGEYKVEINKLVENEDGSFGKGLSILEQKDLIGYLVRAKVNTKGMSRKNASQEQKDEYKRKVEQIRSKETAEYLKNSIIVFDEAHFNEPRYQTLIKKTILAGCNVIKMSATFEGQPFSTTSSYDIKTKYMKGFAPKMDEEFAKTKTLLFLKSTDDKFKKGEQVLFKGLTKEQKELLEKSGIPYVILDKNYESSAVGISEGMPDGSLIIVNGDYEMGFTFDVEIMITTGEVEFSRLLPRRAGRIKKGTSIFLSLDTSEGKVEDDAASVLVRMLLTDLKDRDDLDIFDNLTYGDLFRKDIERMKEAIAFPDHFGKEPEEIMALSMMKIYEKEKQKSFPRQINVNFDNDLIKLTKLKKQEVKEVLNTDKKARDEIVDLYELADGVKIEIDYNVERKPARDELKFGESSLSKEEQKKLENYDSLIEENTELKTEKRQLVEEKERLQKNIEDQKEELIKTFEEIVGEEETEKLTEKPATEVINEVKAKVKGAIEIQKKNNKTLETNNRLLEKDIEAQKYFVESQEVVRASKELETRINEISDELASTKKRLEEVNKDKEEVVKKRNELSKNKENGNALAQRQKEIIEWKGRALDSGRISLSNAKRSKKLKSEVEELKRKLSELEIEKANLEREKEELSQEHEKLLSSFNELMEKNKEKDVETTPNLPTDLLSEEDKDEIIGHLQMFANDLRGRLKETEEYVREANDENEKQEWEKQVSDQLMQEQKVLGLIEKVTTTK